LRVSRDWLLREVARRGRCSREVAARLEAFWWVGDQTQGKEDLLEIEREEKRMAGAKDGSVSWMRSKGPWNLPNVLSAVRVLVILSNIPAACYDCEASPESLSLAHSCHLLAVLLLHFASGYGQDKKCAILIISFSIPCP